MMTDLKKIGEWFTKKNLWATPFNQFSEDMMQELVTVVLSSPGFAVPPGGWVKPFLSQGGELIIPPEAHPKYRYWLPDGQSLLETLRELGASPAIISRYVELEEGVPF